MLRRGVVAKKKLTRQTRGGTHYRGLKKRLWREAHLVRFEADIANQVKGIGPATQRDICRTLGIDKRLGSLMCELNENHDHVMDVINRLSLLVKDERERLLAELDWILGKFNERGHTFREQFNERHHDWTPWPLDVKTEISWDHMTHKELKELHLKMRPKLDTHPAIGNRGYKQEVKARVMQFARENAELKKGAAEIDVRVPHSPIHP